MARRIHDLPRLSVARAQENLAFHRPPSPSDSFPARCARQSMHDEAQLILSRAQRRSDLVLACQLALWAILVIGTVVVLLAVA